MSKDLYIGTTSDGTSFCLPAQAVTQTFALLAMTGAGKSNSAVVIAEEMTLKGLPWVAIDPKGDWWGIRSGSRGLPVPIFGGMHGDVPLDASAGEHMADVIFDLNLTCVLDVSDFNSKQEQVRFLTAFAERIFRRHAKHPTPRHLFLEETEEYIPQVHGGERANMATCIGAWSKLVKQGRRGGLGITLISQRSASVAKNVLTQTGTMIAMRTTSPQDREAIKGWVEHHAAGKEIVQSLPTLGNGEAWICSPHFLKVMVRVQFRQRFTFDSGATPEVGKKMHVPTLAEVDLKAIAAKLTASIEEAKANDPAALRAEIAALKKALVPAKAVSPVERVVEVPVLGPHMIAIGQLQDLTNKATDALSEVSEVLAGVRGGLERIRRTVEETCQNFKPSGGARPPSIQHGGRPPSAATGSFSGRSTKEIITDRPPTGSHPRTVPVAPKSTSVPRDKDANPSAPAGLSSTHRRILTVLAQRDPKATTRNQVCVFCELSAKSSHIDNLLSSMRVAGLISGSGSAILLTQRGIDALGQFDPLPTGRDLLKAWVARLSSAEARILEYLAIIHPGTASRAEVGTAVNLSLESSHIDNLLSHLRTLELINGPGSAIKASDDFFE